MDRVKRAFKPSLLSEDDVDQDDFYSGGDGWSSSADSDEKQEIDNSRRRYLGAKCVWAIAVYLFFNFELAGQGWQNTISVSIQKHASGVKTDLVATTPSPAPKTKTKDAPSNWSDFEKNAPHVYNYVNYNLWFYTLDIFFIAVVCGLSYVTGSQFLVKLGTMPVCLIETFAIGINVWGYM